MTVLRSAVATHPGNVRAANQDVALVSGDMVAIADGMGGHVGGDVAARTAIEELFEAFLRNRTADGFVVAAQSANRAVWRKSRVDRNLHGMGTTLTAAMLSPVAVSDDAGAVAVQPSEETAPVHVVLVNVGDSRGYLLDRDGSTVTQVTEDHSVVEEMVRQGELSPAEAAVHPHRHVLTRVVGIEPEVALDIWDIEAAVGTRILLCSDGLTNEVADEEIADVLLAAAGPEEAVNELVARALGHGGLDNVTVVVADVAAEETDPAELPVRLVPARPPRPEAPVMGVPELTGAIPIAVVPPAQASPGAPGPSPADAGPSPGAPGASASAPGAPAGAAVGAAAGAGAGLAAGLAAEALPTDGPAGQTDGAAGDATLAIGTRPATAGSDEGQNGSTGPVEVAVPRQRGKGRSMTVRQAPVPPPIDGTIALGRTGGTGGVPVVGGTGGGRPIVLVPGKGAPGPNDRIVTVRVVLFVLLLVGLMGGAAATVIWFNQRQYFVGLHGDDVAIYQGRPGGLLWLKPHLIETSHVRTTDLLSGSVSVLESGITESSLGAAEQVVGRLKNEKQDAIDGTTTTTTSTTTTSSTTSTTLAGGLSPTSPTYPPTTYPPTTYPPTTGAPVTTQPATSTTVEGPPTTQPSTGTTSGLQAHPSESRVRLMASRGT